MLFVRRRAVVRLTRCALACMLLGSVAVPAQARKLHAEIGVGMSHFVDRGDGTWYQQALPHQLSLNSPALMLGVYGRISARTNWHVDLFHLGRASSDSWDVMDNHYDPQRHQCLGHCAQLSHFVGGGALWGAAAMLGVKPLANGRVELEAGPWLYHQSWSVTIPNFYSSTGYAPANGWAPWSSSGDAIYHSAQQWGLGAAAGVSLRWHAYRATLLAFFNNKNFGLGSDPWPPIWRSEFVLFAGRRF